MVGLTSMTLLTRAAGLNKLGKRGLTPSLSELQLAVSSSFSASTLSLPGLVSSGSAEVLPVAFAVKGVLNEGRRLKQNKFKATRSNCKSNFIMLLQTSASPPGLLYETKETEDIG